MTKIVLTQGSWGVWTAENVEGWDRVEVKHRDREQALHLLLAEMGVEVIQKGEHWVNGERREWQVSNKDGARP
jgi:hypothetical protein